MRFWIGVSAAFGAGTLIGIGVGTLLVEDKLKKEYKEATASHWRAVQAAKIDVETPSLTEEDLIRIRHHDDDSVELEGGTVTIPDEIPTESLQPVTDISSLPQSTNPYHTAVEQTTSQEVYASYAELSQEDYEDEDGRKKEQLTMLYNDDQPVFFHNGMEIETSRAMDLAGSTIVDDMREAVREGIPFVWRRNNQTDTDYEVVFEQP